MLTTLQQMDIHLLKRQGHSIREIARQTGYARNTVRAILRTEGLRQPQARRRASLLEPYHAYLRERHAATGLSCVRLHAELQAQGFTGGIHQIRRFVATLASASKHAARATVRFETGPGEQAQVDWKHVGTYTDSSGRRITLSAFVMVLSFSRAIFVRFVSSMKLPVLIDCHREAFQFFGGVPAAILYDNMKQVRLSRAQWNPAFLDFAGHHGFAPKTCQLYRPRTKGKVERAIRYLDDNFLHARIFADLAELNAQGLHWCRHTANTRLHATTGRRPDELLAEEQPNLAPLANLRPYALRQTRTVDAEALVAYQNSRYSVPPEHIGTRVEVAAESGQIVIRTAELIIAEHHPAAKPRSCVIAPAHLQALWQRTIKNPTAENREPPPRCTVRFTQEVQTRPLTHYAEACP
jgi:transposase